MIKTNIKNFEPVLFFHYYRKYINCGHKENMVSHGKNTYKQNLVTNRDGRNRFVYSTFVNCPFCVCFVLSKNLNILFSDLLFIFHLFWSYTQWSFYLIIFVLRDGLIFVIVGSKNCYFSKTHNLVLFKKYVKKIDCFFLIILKL